MYDPNFPATNADLESLPFRTQFQGLKALIDAVPAGPPGPQGLQGIQGPPFANAVVEGVATLNPGEPATANVSFDGTNVRLSFGLPRGNDGTNGNDGAPGPQGIQGLPGAPFANAVVEGVTTLAPGSNATVGAFFDGSTVHLSFAIPRGADGSNGINGSNGTDGAPGAPGEVTNSQLATAINGTSSNSNSVATLDSPFVNDPPTLADLELMRAKVNEMILALRR